MKETLSKPTTFKELQERRVILERSMKLNTHNAKQAFNEAGNELPKFLLKKVAVPAALATTVAIGINKLTQTTASKEQTYQMQEEVEENRSLLAKIWLFALPIVQPYIKSFIKEQINNRFGNSGS